MLKSVQIFNKISNHYEKFNFLSSFGIEKFWRRKLRKFIDSKNNFILDLGVGTGVFSEAIKENGFIIGIDPSFKMIMEGKKKREFIKFVMGVGEKLPFKNESFDCIISAYVMRNLDSVRITLSEALRVLKPGGKIIILEFFPPKNVVLRFFYKFYLGRIVPFFYGFFYKDTLPIKYFSNSIFSFMKVSEFSSLLNNIGFVKIKIVKTFLGISFYFLGEKSE